MQLTIRKVELKNRSPYDPYIGRYSPNTEYREFYLDCEAEDAEGVTVYFKTPAMMRTVTTGGPFAVVCYSGSPNAQKWMTEVGEDKVATAGKPNNNVLEPTIKSGDVIDIKARLKTEKVSRKGNRYRVYTHCKLETPE